MELLALIIVYLMTIFGIYKTTTIKDWPKKRRKLQFELKMSWAGFSSSTYDLLHRSVDETYLFPQPHKVAVMTGGNRGIGLEVLKKLLQCEMTVMLAVRDPEACKETVERSIAPLLTKGKVFYEKCDASDMTSVKDFAIKAQEKFSSIHLLINNAGILSAPYVITKDGFISQMAVNYFGHFLLTHLLMPQLRAGSSEKENSRIVNVASCVHNIGRIRYDDLIYKNYYRASMVYADSKLAQIMFTNHLKKICEEGDWKVQVHSVHPGMADTEIFKSSILGPLAKKPLSRHWFKTPEQASRGIIQAAIARELEGKSGTYIRNCQIVNCAKNANNPEDWRKLFQLTCDLLQIENFSNSENNNVESFPE